MNSTTKSNRCYFYGTYCLNKAVGKVKCGCHVMDVCVDCGWELYYEVDGDIEIVESITA